MSVDRVSLLASIATDVLNVDGVSPNDDVSQAAHVVDTAADQAMTIGVDEDYPADLKPASSMYAAAAEALSSERRGGVSSCYGTCELHELGSICCCASSCSANCCCCSLYCD